MINYTPANQLSLDLFDHPFEKALDKNNRWVKLAALIPWDTLALIYSGKLHISLGRKTVDLRTVIAALIVKHKLRLDDRGTIEMIKENVYLQYFCGLKGFTTQAIFDASLFVDIRKRMGGKEFDSFNKEIIEKSEQIKPHQSCVMSKDKAKQTEQPNRGTLKIDATIADQEITYPTDLKLLNTSRENLERIITLLHNHKKDGDKPRTYCRVARKAYLKIAKKKNKTNKEIRRGKRSQLQYVFRDLKIIDKQIKHYTKQLALSKRDKALLATIRKVYEQQKWMYDNKANSCKHRIVNIFQPHVRPMPRGKDKSKTEFGSKLGVSEVNGFCRVDNLSWEAYNESADVEDQVEGFKSLYGCYPKILLADGIYLNKENRTFLKSKGIKICGKPLGRPPQEKQTPQQKYRKKKKNAERNHIEGKFGQAKRGYGLNNIKARLPETSESWINAIFFVMNLTKLLQVAEKYPSIFVRFFNSVLKRLSLWLKLFFSPVDRTAAINS